MRLPEFTRRGTKEYRIISTNNSGYFKFSFRVKRRFGWTKYTVYDTAYPGMEAVERAARYHARDGVVKELGVLPTVLIVPVDASTGQPVPSLAD